MKLHGLHTKTIAYFLWYASFQMADFKGSIMVNVINDEGLEPASCFFVAGINLPIESLSFGIACQTCRISGS